MGSFVDRHDRVLGALLGCAIGDASGLPFEGLPPHRVARRFTADRYRFFGRTGFVSDDTEQSALVAQALAMGEADDHACRAHFRRSMMGWLLRLPFGIGGATLRACLRMLVGFPEPGVRSAGNGAAMRAGIVGVHFARDSARRRRTGRQLATLTHTDERAIEAALYVAEVAAHAAVAEPAAFDPPAVVRRARTVVEEPELVRAIDDAIALAEGGAPPGAAGIALGNTGFVVHSIAICTFALLRGARSPMEAIELAIRAGGDTDTHAAIVGGWMGALHGASALPGTLIVSLHDGPFGHSHLCGLSAALVHGTPPPRWSWPGAFLRNLALYPVVLAHGLAHLLP
ncbi:MAG: ADP-ribosylglycohydrolase family protein [Myxococcales bacterium]|nr:ADP-ribosylglycohydrolase family protein [Myxococcales bacterium]